MAQQIFYSWQSDLPGASNRSLVQASLEIAINELRKEELTMEPVLDRDTGGRGRCAGNRQHYFF